MIYFDNAATSLLKPPGTAEATAKAILSLGSPGRGAYDASLNASRLVYETRCLIADLIGAENANTISFSQNATDSLNTVLYGLFKRGDHIITTVTEHNSVLRPLYMLSLNGVEISHIKADKNGVLDYNSIENLIKNNTKAFVINHASNVTGNINDLSVFSKLKDKYGILLIVDGAQTAGIVPINVKQDNIDIYCFTGHKGLMGPQGTGGSYIKSGITVKPLKSGGSGFNSYDRFQPSQMPDALEAGTLNCHGIAGLNYSLKYILKKGMDEIQKKENILHDCFIQNLNQEYNIHIYGNIYSKKRVPIVALNISDIDSSKISYILSHEYDIATRAGAHCAPMMHQALGTVTQGIVRFSFNYFNTIDEVIQAANAINEIARSFK